MSSTFLSADEVKELTDYVRYGKQREALRAMGVPFWTNPSGRPIVSRALFETQRAEETAKPGARRRWQSSKIKTKAG